jgi:hypothetical protein
VLFDSTVVPVALTVVPWLTVMTPDAFVRMLHCSVVPSRMTRMPVLLAVAAA